MSIYRDLSEPATAPTAAPGGGEKLEKYYPSVTFTKDCFPELSKLDVGDLADITFICKVVSKEESENYSCARLELHKASIGDVAKDAPKLSTTQAITVKNDADVALEAISAIKRTL